MKKINFIFIFCALAFALSAQVEYKYTDNHTNGNNTVKSSDANISGHTVEKGSHNHIGYINISLKGTTIGVATDATGHYFLKNLPIGDYIIVASAVGYKTIELPVKLIKGKTVEINFEMEEDAIMLDNVVVSANRNETTRRKASNIVNVISGKLFETTNSICLAQGLNFQPGLRVENNCQNCGFQQVRINGLEGPYSQILIDSRPIFSALAGVYGIEQIPTNMIDRVEVVRGGGSALFGSNAIAGTINIITKEPLNNSLSVSNTTMLVGGTAKDINTNFNAALVSDDYKAGVSIYGSTRQRDGWDADGDGFTELGKLQGRNVGFRSYFKTSQQSKLTVEYHNLGEYRRGGNNLDLPPHQADVCEMTEHNINSGGVKWEFFTPEYKHRFSIYSSAQQTDRNSYYGAKKNLNAYGKTDDLAFVTGMQYAYEFSKLMFMPAQFTVGTEFSYNKLIDTQLAYDRDINQEIDIKSAFLQNEWKNKQLSLLLGMRVDKHKFIKDAILSPRINVRYNPVEWANFRVSYASGFRAPQAFDEDLHITAVGGEVQLIVIDPDLKPEHSDSYSISADFYKNFGKVQTNLLIEGFYTDITDVFYLNETGKDADNNTILTRTNGSGAVVKGLNVEAKVIPSAKINIQGGFTIQTSLYKEAQTWSESTILAASRTMFRAPDNYGYLSASYLPVKALTVSLNGIYTGSMMVQHYGVEVDDDQEVKTPRFFDLGCKVSYDFRISSSAKMQLNAGVQNIFNSFQKDFDKGEDRDAGYMYGPGLPRSYFIGLKFNL
ncbi:MAG: TonB-dependent receptor [Bacteroidetes bacterium]|nr:TonB-dependent receptor [Bacteroidota bacterium]